MILEALGAGAVIGLLIPALRAASWLPRLLDTPNAIQSAISIFIAQLASSWLVWWAGIQLELNHWTASVFSAGRGPGLIVSPWVLILAAGVIGILINSLVLRVDLDPAANGNHQRPN